MSSLLLTSACGILLAAVRVVKASALKTEKNWLCALAGGIVKEGKGEGFKAMCKTCAAHAKKADKPAKKATTKKK